MIYIDSSALLKLLFEESESAALQQWLSDRSDTTLVSSDLVKVEVLRATRRLGQQALPAARTLVSQIDCIPLSTDLINEAADVGASLLRTLDALHLASAMSIRAELTSFVAYDSRLISCAFAAGLEPVSPR